MRLDHGAQLNNLERFPDRNFPHEDAAVFLQSQQAGLFKNAERLANRSARDALTIGQPGLVELVAGTKFAGENQALNFLLHRAGQAAAVQHGNGGMSRGDRVGGTSRVEEESAHGRIEV